MSAALVRHDRLLHKLIDECGGHVFKTVGDGVWAVFDQATSALEAALVIQATIRSVTWDQIGALAVRVALNSGEAECRDNDYFGPTLSRLSRLVEIAAGGQILASRATLRLALEGSHEHIRARDLGTRTLRGLDEPMHVYAVSGDVEARTLPTDEDAPEAADTAAADTTASRRKGATGGPRRPIRQGPPPALRVQMLGGFRIECDGQPADHTRSDAARGLRLFKCLLSRKSTPDRAGAGVRAVLA